MNWILIGQYLSYAVALVSAFFSYLSNKNTNRTTKELELLKEKFARETEERNHKRETKISNQTSIIAFLSSINEFSALHSPQNKQAALSSCSKVLPILNEEQRMIVRKAMYAIQKAETSGWNDETTKHADEIIFSTNQKFLKALGTLFQED